MNTLTTSLSEYYRLRTEWLRYKSCLYDSLTGLPAFPAVVEEVRRTLEERGAIEVVYLDLGRSGWYETKLGWAGHDGMVRDFALVLAELRRSGDLHAEDVICLLTVRSDRFLVFLAEGVKGGEVDRGSRLIDFLRSRLTTLPADSSLRGIRLATGRSRLEEDPMVRTERAIQQAVTDAMLAGLGDLQGTEAVRREELLTMIAEGSVRTVFHPVIRLSDGVPFGYEALTRPLSASSFDSVEELFAFAEGTEHLLPFERLCWSTAITAASALAGRGLLFLNASVRAVEDPEWWSSQMEDRLKRSGFTPRGVVIEITERMAIARLHAFQEALRTFKERGYLVAVDDMGAGYATLQSIAAIEPDFLKFDVSLVRDIDRSSIKRSLLRTLKSLADKIRARVIAEGVERPQERDTLVDLGIELAQGYLFYREE